MKLSEARERFIEAWGNLGNSWGINRTMAQIHAFLLISEIPQTTDDIMEALVISRGNANMNLRDLAEWGLAYRRFKAGDRKEYFEAEKDMWKCARQIIKERRKREIEPALQLLAELKEVEGNAFNTKQFIKTISDIERMMGKADSAFSTAIKLDENKVLNTLLKLVK